MVAEPWLIPDFKLFDDCICAELLAFITQNNPALWDFPLQLVFGFVSWYTNTSDDSICDESPGLAEQYILDLEGRYLTAIRCFEYILDPAYDAARRYTSVQAIKLKNPEFNSQKAAILVHSN